MSIHLHRDLEHLQQDILALADAVQEAVHRAIRALREKNAALAEKVIAGDDRIDQQENRIDDECLKVLALHQPVAVDLRRITAVMQISTDLERMADLAVDIAEGAVQLCGLPLLPVPEKLQHMTDVTVGMVRQCLDAFFRLDPHLARQVCRLDDEVDRLNAAIIQELAQAMKCSPDAVEPALWMFSATRCLERIADHATNIAEDVVYLVEGISIRHHPEALAAGEPEKTAPLPPAGASKRVERGAGGPEAPDCCSSRHLP